MNTLIIYDNTGFVISIMRGEPAPREPQGVPFIWVEIPQGKQLKITDGIGVDISVTPHQAILEDIPLTEIEQVRLEMARSNTELFETMLMMNGGV
jgi:hypothetical protein